MYLFLSGQTCF